MFHPEISANSIIDLFSIVSLYLQADSTEKDEKSCRKKSQNKFFSLAIRSGFERQENRIGSKVDRKMLSGKLRK